MRSPTLLDSASPKSEIRRGWKAERMVVASSSQIVAAPTVCQSRFKSNNTTFCIILSYSARPHPMANGEGLYLVRAAVRARIGPIECARIVGRRRAMRKEHGRLREVRIAGGAHRRRSWAKSSETRHSACISRRLPPCAACSEASAAARRARTSRRHNFHRRRRSPGQQIPARHRAR